MRTLILSTTLISTIVSAEVLNLTKGWNLVGLSDRVEIEKLKDSEIERIYIYNTPEKKWLESGVIEPYQGAWIFSNSEKELNFDTYSNIYENSIGNIEIYQGWNLLSLPTKSVVSPRVFKEFDIVWKYSNSKWSNYSGNSTNSNYPKIDFIGSGEGFWIKSQKSESIDLSEKESNLENFNSEDELYNYLKSMVTYNNSYRSNSKNYIWGGGIVPLAETTSDDLSTNGSSSVENATTTNLQESGVDESDVLKHNGDKIFYILNRWEETNSIYATTFDRVFNLEKPLQIEVDSKPTELYLIDNKLIAIYPNNYDFWGVWSYVDYSIWSESSKVEIFDISNLDSISKIASFKIDGNIIDSRVTNSKLYLITRYMPYQEIEYSKIEFDCKDTEFNYYGYLTDENGSCFMLDYDNPEYKDEKFIPQITNLESNNSSNLLNYQTLYAPNKFNQSPFITTITSFDIDNFNSQDSISVVGNSSTIYASNRAIYSVSNEYPLFFNWREYEERSAIYKFSISDNLEYIGKEFVEGRVLNQFSLSEYQDILRIATTKWSSFREDSDNMIFTLSGDRDFNLLGELKGLGKERETIKAVRFLGERGFIVTFEQTDPLYTVDLSTPESPVAVGELEIDGYSQYFHPIDENRILSIGRDANSTGSELGVQIQLFDISDFSNPTLTDKVTIGDSWNTNSEALYNHKAFTFRNSDLTFALPISDYNYQEVEKVEISKDEELNSTNEIDTELGTVAYTPNSYYEKYLDIYRVLDNNISHIKKIESNSTEHSYSNQRGVIFTKDNIDYALYLDGESLSIEQIE